MSSLTWTLLNSSVPHPLLTPDWLFPWVTATTFLFDVFYINPSFRSKGIYSSSTYSGIFESLSYSWLSGIIEVKDALHLDDLSDSSALTPSIEYEARFGTASSFPKDVAYHMYWQFIVCEHRRQLIISTLLRLVCDASLFAIPWQLQGLLTRPTSASVIIMFCSRVIGALAGNFSGYHLRKLAIQYRSALSSALHRKTLRLGDFEPKTPVADLSTLSEVDTLVLFRSAQTFPDIWNLPCQVVFCLCGLAFLLPYQAFVAIVILIVRMFIFPTK